MSSTTKLNSEKAASILNEVPQERAFYFYSGIDRPLAVTAKSLTEFCERIKTVEPASLDFHTGRRDFERWVSMLGDNVLSKRLGEVRNSRAQGEPLRSKLYSTTRSRVDQLQRVSMKIPR